MIAAADEPFAGAVATLFSWLGRYHFLKNTSFVHIFSIYIMLSIAADCYKYVAPIIYPLQKIVSPGRF